MKKGELILIPFPFADLSGNKNRPDLVLCANKLDILVAFISTQFKWKAKMDIIIKPSMENSLKKAFLIRISKLTTIDKSLALGRLGEIDAGTIKLVNKNLKTILKLEG